MSKNPKNMRKVNISRDEHRAELSDESKTEEKYSIENSNDKNLSEEQEKLNEEEFEHFGEENEEIDKELEEGEDDFIGSSQERDSFNDGGSELQPERVNRESQDENLESSSTQDEDINDEEEDIEEEIQSKIRNIQRAGNMALVTLKASITILTNPITWVVILLIIIGLIVGSGTKVIGRSDYNIHCGHDGVGSVSLSDDADDFTRQSAVAAWLTSTPFEQLGGGPMTKEQAAGVIGNLIVESAGGRPTYVETISMTNPDYYLECDNDCVIGWGSQSNKAIGMVQWDSGRRLKLAEFAKEQGGQWHDINIQLRWLKEELDGTEGANLAKGGFTEPGLTARDYADLWNELFERSAFTGDHPFAEKRRAAADEFNNKYVGGGSFASTCVTSNVDISGIIMGPVPSEIQYYNGVELSRPIDSSITAYTGGWGWYRPFGELRMHNGVDIAPLDGQEGHALYSMIDGIVTEVSFDANGWGNWVTVQSSKDPTFAIRLAHLRDPAVVQVGERVSRGQLLGALGDTGLSTAPHVHIEFLRNGSRINPAIGFDFINS